MLKAWPKLPAVSIDYGILEKARNVAAVAADIGWSDLGSWESLAEILPKDKKGNSTQGNVLSLDCRDALIWASNRLVAAVGVEDMIVIDTPDALLVCPKHRSQDVKKLVEALKKRKARVC
jgi:mannose-1-phosphate guanylyltransferase